MSFLYDQSGNRKYLTKRERAAFLNTVAKAPADIRTFCETLVYTGGRISEVLALSPSSFDFDEHTVRIECLKKRRHGLFRAIPIPESLLSLIERTHRINSTNDNSMGFQRPIWPWCRTTGWKYIKQMMTEAGVQGVQASPKGLRHSFGVIAVQSGVPLNMVRKWLGHSRMSTTAIYANAVGEEEREIAFKFWKSFEDA